jgi:hypothetical protein
VDGRNQRYRSPMKNLTVISLLLVTLLLGSMALAQGVVPAVPEAPQPQNSAAAEQPPTPAKTGSSADELLSQYRQYPRFPHGPMYGPSYGSAYRPRPSLPPVVGALIGFGVGAAIGAGKPVGPGQTHVPIALIGGGFGAMFGGLIGAIAAVPHSLARGRSYRPSGPEDDEEGSLRPGSHKVDGEKTASVKPASGDRAPVAPAVDIAAHDRFPAAADAE